MREASAASGNSVLKVLFASFIGTTIEFFDFYIYATASVLVFPKIFFPATDPAAAMLASLATFVIAFVARPFGSLLFGHFGDRIGRKATLVAALLTMGLSTVAIGLLPTYPSVGLVAPALLALCRFGQGFGLGGEWGGAVLLAVENAPPRRRALYGLFPQLGAPIGFILSSAVFLWLSEAMGDQDFFTFGWRIPFLASALLVLVGLYVRLSISETAVFRAAQERREVREAPMIDLFRGHAGAIVIGTVISLVNFVMFYLMSVFALLWGTTKLGFRRDWFLKEQLFAMLFFAIFIGVGGWLAERGRRSLLMASSVLIAVFGFYFARLFEAGPVGAIVTMCIGLALLGLVYGPLGTTLSELFPTNVRYTGSSLTFNLGGIFGASLASYLATWLAKTYGLPYVGYCIIGAAGVSFLGLWVMRETRHKAL
jgi:MFS family permease